MIRVLTAQLNVGKKIPKNGNVLFLNTTAATGCSRVEKALAPSWELVSMYKSGIQPTDGRTLEQKYADMYIDQLNNLPDDVKAYLKRLAKGDEKFDVVIVSCYCGKGKFCHRHLLMRHLVEHYGFAEGWEITNDDVHNSTMPNGSIISISGSKGVTNDVLKSYFKDEIAKGEICLIDEDYLKKMDLPMHAVHDTECAIERVCTTWTIMSAIINLRQNAKIFPVSYIDTTRLVDNTFIANPTKEGGCPVAKEAIGELVQGNLNCKSFWKVVELNNDPSEVRDLIKRFGYTTHVTINKSYEDVDHAASMDTYYQICKG